MLVMMYRNLFRLSSLTNESDEHYDAKQRKLAFATTKMCFLEMRKK